MCFLVVERYSVCRCLYYKHSVDMCDKYGKQGHAIQERTVLVGYTCGKHSQNVNERVPPAADDGSSSSEVLSSTKGSQHS
ncbi:hypothetical protein F5882DRAFT_251057, partial [Hyaloscypha sp. PMI_1271]